MKSCISLLMLVAVTGCAASPRFMADDNMACAGNVSTWFTNGLIDVPDFSDSGEITKDQLRQIAGAIPERERRALIETTSSVLTSESRVLSAKRYAGLPEKIDDAFDANAARAFGVSGCGNDRDVGEFILVFVQGGLTRSYERSDAFVQKELDVGKVYRPSTLVATGVLLEINAIDYDFDALSLAMSAER